MTIKAVVFNVWLAVSCATMMQAADPFEGFWVNVDKSAPAITKARIADVKGQLLIHLWGACQPVDCDWGQSVLQGVGKIRRVVWQQNFAVRRQELVLVEGVVPRLRIMEHTHFTDNSGRADYNLTQTLEKVPPPPPPSRVPPPPPPPRSQRID
jgi:hypothetical protein